MYLRSQFQPTTFGNIRQPLGGREMNPAHWDPFWAPSGIR